LKDGMYQVLTLHPDCRCDALARIDAQIARPDATVLLVEYSVAGNLNDLVLPPAAAPARADRLWLHTCFEAFVRPAGVDSYFEFNFAPSTQWAAYRFDLYREGMKAAEIAPPRLEVERAAQRLVLRARLTLPDKGTWRLGLSAVIEETNGRKSYWALAHPPGKPDFHHSDCFALELPAA
jgi:hypothetical protein